MLPNNPSQPEFSRSDLDLDDDEIRELNLHQAVVAANNQLDLVRAIHSPKVFVRKCVTSPNDPNQVFTMPQFISGGNEIFNDPNAFHIDKDPSILSPYLTEETDKIFFKAEQFNSMEDVPNVSQLINAVSGEGIEEVLEMRTRASKWQGGIRSEPITPKPIPQVERESMSEFFKKIGLPFITDTPSYPKIKLKLEVSGPTRFSVPFLCHSFTVDDSQVVCVIDTRAFEQESQDSLMLPECDVDADVFTVKLTTPDGNSYAIYPPSPVPNYFDLGKLRIVQFIRCEE